jgi:hypothetical protein
VERGNIARPGARLIAGPISAPRGRRTACRLLSRPSSSSADRRPLLLTAETCCILRPASHQPRASGADPRNGIALSLGAYPGHRARFVWTDRWPPGQIHVRGLRPDRNDGPAARGSPEPDSGQRIIDENLVQDKPCPGHWQKSVPDRPRLRNDATTSQEVLSQELQQEEAL